MSTFNDATHNPEASQLRAQLLQLMNTLQHYSTYYTKFQEERVGWTNERINQLDKLSDKDVEIKALYEQNEAVRDKMHDLESEIVVLQARLDTMDRQAQLQVEIAKTEAELETARAVKDAKDDHRVKTDGLKAQHASELKELRNTIKELTKHVHEFKVNIAKLEAQNDARSQELVIAEQRAKKDLQDMQTRHEKDLNRRDARIKELEAMSAQRDGTMHRTIAMNIEEIRAIMKETASQYDKVQKAAGEMQKSQSLELQAITDSINSAQDAAKEEIEKLRQELPNMSVVVNPPMPQIPEPLAQQPEPTITEGGATEVPPPTPVTHELTEQCKLCTGLNLSKPCPGICSGCRKCLFICCCSED